jgi:hypothetical protein
MGEVIFYPNSQAINPESIEIYQFALLGSADEN